MAVSETTPLYRGSDIKDAEGGTEVAHGLYKLPIAGPGANKHFKHGAEGDKLDEINELDDERNSPENAETTILSQLGQRNPNLVMSAVSQMLTDANR